MPPKATPVARIIIIPGTTGITATNIHPATTVTTEIAIPTPAITTKPPTGSLVTETIIIAMDTQINIALTGRGITITVTPTITHPTTPVTIIRNFDFR
jgi:hypothetical protein